MNKTQQTIRALRSIGYSYPDIRAALIKLNKINIRALARKSEVTAPTIFAAAYGKRKNAAGRKILADHLGVDVEYLFPEDPGGQ